MDIGVSSHHLDEPCRGFSFRSNAALDMRMNQKQKLCAYTIVNKWNKEQLNEIICKYGQEKHHKIIVEALIKERQKQPIKTTFQLASIIDRVLRRWHKKQSLPAPTKTFQALRIAVNDELNALQEGLDNAFELLDKNGRLIVISFHSLEDKLVKKKFRQLSCVEDNDPFVPNRQRKAQAKLLTRKPVVATKEEVSNNSRCACAKLRAIEKQIG